MSRERLYVILQLGGWALYAAINLIVFSLSGGETTLNMKITFFLIFVIGLITSHLYRSIIIRLEWYNLNITALIPRVLFASVGFGILFEFTLNMAALVFTTSSFDTRIAPHLQNILVWFILFVIWSLFYFTYHFFERYRNEEIKNLKWQAKEKEIELNKLKSQLNPHFIFNSMNSIRALIDEDPKKAKKSVTQLANILRNSLMLGTRKTVPFQDEMDIVNDYIQLEKTRYEERLRCSKKVEEEAHRFQVPSLMIQTLVENGIKHGISKLPSGGELKLSAFVQGEKLHVRIENPGLLDLEKKPETGFGLVNTRQRLNLLYGDQAEFSIRSSNDQTVITEIVLPSEPI
jgi:two-component system LytT family sensor kinase